ncbi:MAG: hypothetical protein IE909_15185 [Campylobacterales bacterium]|nr:hypothetical protein [Campylobacterales bacterium]
MISNFLEELINSGFLIANNTNKPWEIIKIGEKKEDIFVYKFSIEKLELDREKVEKNHKAIYSFSNLKINP